MEQFIENMLTGIRQWVNGKISDVNTDISEKQDAIIDLDEIRSGASLGSTALQPSDISEWAKMPTKPQYSAEEITSAVSSTVISTIWKGTQAEYDDIEVKEYNTLYIISNETEQHPNNEIWYTSVNKDVVWPTNSEALPNIISNSYDAVHNKGVITFSENIVNIGIDAFKEKITLKTLSLPNSVLTIGNNAFHSCLNLLKVEFGNSVSSIGEYAFSHCVSLKDISFPDSVTTLGKGVLYNNIGLVNIKLPNYITSVPFDCCSGCINLETVVLETNTTNISEFAFNGCFALHTVVFNEGFTELKRNVFERCTGLRNIHLPSTLQTISDAVFISCSNLSYISYSGTITQWNNISKASDWREGVPANTVYCLDGNVGI